MKTILTLIFFFFVSLVAAEVDTLFVLHTTDIHGQIFPYDYYLDQTADFGMAKLYTRIQKYRNAHQNVILLDGGDIFEGSLFDAYFEKLNADKIHPNIAAMNMMNYDAFTVGNHDIEIGRRSYVKCKEDSKFPWLAANGILGSGVPFFKPYTILERDNLKIGVLGISTPSLQRLKENAEPRIYWEEIESTLRLFLPSLRPQVDILIGLFHFGFEELIGLEKFTSQFDVILGGHVHKTIPALNDTIQTTNEPALLMAGSHAEKLGIIKIVYEKNNDSIEIISKTCWNESIENETPSKQIMNLNKYHETRLKYIRQQIATAEDTITTKFSRFQDSALIEMINKAQMEFMNAEISFAACFDTTVTFQPGPVLYKDILSLYIYKNKLCLVEMTGQQIKDYLEICAEYFFWDDLIAINPKMKGYNYDIAEGIDYEIDVTKPVGNRITKLQLSETKQPLDLSKTYRVAMNNYRALGGGGHLDKIVFAQKNILKTSEKLIPRILLEYVQKYPVLTNACNNNWQIIKSKN